MKLTWRARLEQHPALADMSSWPTLDLSLIPKPHRRDYLRNTRMVKAVLAGTILKRAAEVAGVTSGRVNHVLNRCLGGEDDCPPALRQGLVPYRGLEVNDPKRARGRFAQLLIEVPGLREGLDQMLLDRLKDRPWAEVPSPAAYHSLFKALLAKENWPLHAYPYTTTSLAYESVRQDLKKRWTHLCQVTKSRKRVFTELATNFSERRLYDRIEIDEQHVDCQQSTVGIELTLGKNLPPLRLPRLTLLCAIDTATDCILCFLLVLTAHPTQRHLLALLQHCVNRWPARTITTNGLDLPPGAGFPSTDMGLPLPLPRVIALDNAWMHLAYSVKAFCTRDLGATLSFSKPKSPTVRRAIETCFNRLNHWLSHRLNSTAGSSVTDPKRESAKNRQGVPMVSLPEFEEALYVTLAESNNQVRPNLAGATPLETLRYQAEQNYLVDVDEEQRAAWNPFRGSKEVTVHDLSDPKRKPYVNFEYLRYKGPGLIALPAGEHKVMIRYDRRDLRRLEVFRLKGQSLGTLVCPGSWLSYPHSLETRRYLFKYCREMVRKRKDPLTEHLLQLRGQLSHPTDVARYLSTYQEFCGGFGLPTSLWPPLPPGQLEVADIESTQATQSNVGFRPANKGSGHRYWSTNLNPGGFR